jgi:hypothetical protein
MELEAIGGVSMGDLAFEIRGKVDNCNGAEGAFLRADTATNAESFGDEGEPRFRGHFDTELSGADHLFHP